MSGGRSRYQQELRRLQIELVKFQRHVIAYDHRILVVFEGRDAAGKDGVIKRLTAHSSPRETRVVALGKPSDWDREGWYFQRFVAHLPAARELVLFNRSWYNRAGVERVMGFCSETDYRAFIEDVVPLERLLARSGIELFKYYLDISRAEQARRLADRRRDPLKQWKVSPIDDAALDRFDDYTTARDEMLARTHHDAAPWYVVRADDKKSARLNVLRHLLSRVDCPDKDRHAAVPDDDIVFEFDAASSPRLEA